MKRSFFMLLITAIIPLYTATAQEKLTIATPNIPSPVVFVSHEVLKKAYQQAGMEIELKRLPAKRSLVDANRGVYDGELARVRNIEKMAPNLVRIPVSVYTTNVVVFTKNKQFPVKGWDSIKPYKTGILRGIALVEAKTKGFNRHMVNSPASLFNLLFAERIDIAIFMHLDGLLELNKTNLHASIKALSPPLMKLKLYHYLHKKNQHLVPKLEKVLAAMERSGELKQIFKLAEMRVIGVD